MIWNMSPPLSNIFIQYAKAYSMQERVFLGGLMNARQNSGRPPPLNYPRVYELLHLSGLPVLD
jgi:hypothetical protein